MEELMNYIMLGYFLHRSLDEIMVKKNDCKDEKKQTIRSEPTNGKIPQNSIN